MNHGIAKAIQILLVVFLLATAAAPACVGSENCSMPCCRHDSQPVSHPADGTASKPCCPQTADPADGIGPGCRFVQHHLALPPGAESGPVFTAAAGGTVLEYPFLWSDGPPALRRADSTPPETPLYLRLQTLLI